MTNKKRPGNKATSPTRRASTAKVAPEVIDSEDVGELSYNSPYRNAQREHGSSIDEFYDYLTKHRFDDPTLNLGYHLMRAERERNLNQSDVAAHTGVYSPNGQTIEKPLTRGYISALLSGRSQAQPETIARVYRAMGANPVEYHVAKLWLEDTEVRSYAQNLPDAALPLVQRISELPVAQQATVVQFCLAAVDTLLLRGSTAGDTTTRSA